MVQLFFHTSSRLSKNRGVLYLIRQMLMNAVCDPRFKMHVAGLPSWRSHAEHCLESFAESLMAVPGLTQGEAFYKMDEMLDHWMHFCINAVRAYDDERLQFSPWKDIRSDNIWRIRQALEELVNDEEDYRPVSDEATEEDFALSWKITKPKKNTAVENKEEQPSKGPLEESFVGRSVAKQKALEDRFLTKVPPSLIRLAKLIGRSGDGIMSSSGTFSSASKSDIGGITTGNDLSGLLPTELALLAEPATQSVFYKNYATRRLQVFASTSHDTKGKKHRDGPIIICMDTSSSMTGEPVLVAKALTMAICIIAQRNRRPVLVIRYSEGHVLFRLRNIGEQKRDLLDFLGTIEMGGNNEDEMFRWLFTDIMPQERDYGSADVLCISDFGWMPIGETSMRLIENEKRKGMMFYALNISKGRGMNFAVFSHNPNGIHPGSPESVCDSLWEYRDGVIQPQSEPLSWCSY